ncbi:aspartic proteinase CDR1-like [Telopea speciosissima]|uniref:aspartic proteinase CDR1-like n=1 Tax=Telopea speciosissima TaxID=54955 RepID=UPI001CC6D642|nr:aspartic proteinase CDR1-like [Telopea speciosissima]
MATFLNLVSFFLLICHSSLSLIKARNGGGFSIDLIHRDSLLSPYYNPSDIPLKRWQNAFRRSIARIDNFKQPLNSKTDVSSTVVSNNGEYLMKISIGTPPVEIMAIADTGSDLIWTQCKPCRGCYKQVAPFFDPKKSSTFRDLSCDSGFCEGLGNQGSCVRDSCQYSYQYGDQSFTIGNLATDTFTLGLGSNSGRFVSLPKKVFGCGHNNNGTFDQNGSGLIGLGGGSLSLISQLGSSIDGKFSYCLVPLTAENETSRLSFGAQAEVSGENVVSTPLVSKSPATFYFLTLEGVSVGDKKLRYKSKAAEKNEEDGNIIIDSGTTLTLLPSEFYDEIEIAVKDAINLTPVNDPELLELCYETDKDIDVPITAHFAGGDVKLNPLNTFVRVSENIVCFAFIPTNDLAIFGNIAQMNFLVGYDIEGGKVSFKPTDCTKQ